MPALIFNQLLAKTDKLHADSKTRRRKKQPIKVEDDKANC